MSRREGRLAGLSQLVRDLNIVREVYEKRMAWARRRVEEEQTRLSRHLDGLEEQLERHKETTRAQYRELGIEPASQTDDLIGGWADASEILDRHLRDKRNLERAESLSEVAGCRTAS